MNKRVDNIMDEARKLTPEERDELLMRLQIEFEDAEAEGTPEEIEAALIEIARHRADEIDSGKVQLVPWEEVLAELRK